MITVGQASHQGLNSLQRRESGQAIVEFLVATMFFLGPLFLVIVALGKFSDIQATSQQAARYAAFERTIYLNDDGWRTRMNSMRNVKTATEIRSEMAQRLVGANRLQIAANDRTRNSLSNGTLQTWTDPGGSKLLERYQDFALTEGSRNLTVVQCPACDVPTVLSIPLLGRLGIDVPHNGLVTESVKVDIARNSTALRRLFPAYTGWNGLQLSDHVALLPNEWMANGRDGVLTVVKDAVPTSKAPLKTALEAAILPMYPFTTETHGFKIGDIRPDEVPRDRLR